MEMHNEHRTPGQLISELLAQHGWTQRVLAIVLGADETGINKIIAGKRPLDAEMALALSELFNVPAERFLDLQKAYELAQARIVTRADPGRASRAQIFGSLPVTDMIKRGWLADVDDMRNVPKIEAALARFFGCESAKDIEILPHAAKKTSVAGDVTPVQLAWIYRVKQIAAEMMVAQYSQAAVETAVSGLRELMEEPTEIRKVPRILTESGIRYLLVEALPGSKIDGVCFWLDEKSPVIAMSMRFDRIDNFWFVLRHEIEHVRRGHGKAAIMLDAELEGERAGDGPNIPEEERQANHAAADFCVPKAKITGFIARKAPYFAERDIIGFARTMRVHPGLVAGQLQHKTQRYDRFRDHLVKIRSHIAPSAIVDGWGDVYPVEG